MSEGTINRSGAQDAPHETCKWAARAAPPAYEYARAPRTP
jgi:hypothetical protein